MACKLGKGIYGRSVFSKTRLFWEKDVVLFQEPHQSVVHHPLKTTCTCSLLAKLGDNYLGGLDPWLASGRAT